MRALLLTIGEFARKTRLTPRAIRYYGRLGLLTAPIRSRSGYRLFDADSLERARFIVKCRSLGFSIAEVAELLRLIGDPSHTCAQVAQLTQHHLDLVDAKLQSLMEIRRILAKNLSRCTDRSVPECAVVEFLKKSA